MSVKLTPSRVSFRDVDGEAYNFAGIGYKEAIVASPLVEEGSGQGLGHPQTNRKFAAKTVVSAEIPVYRTDEESVLEEITACQVKTKLSYGDPVIWQGNLVIERWQHPMMGKVIGEPNIRFNEQTKMVSVSVDCLQVQKGDAEKFRGFGKFRSNGGFLKNVSVVGEDGVIFNPNLPLYDGEGQLQQVEHCIGGEEYKTLMYAVGLLAEQMPEGKATWNAQTGRWEDEDQLIELIESQAKRVTVTRWNLEPSCYSMLKSMYSSDDSFEFSDEECKVVHHQAWCWVGQQTNIVEVPLTATFVGKTRLFAEHVHYLGTEFPQLYSVLLDQLKQNQEMIEDALNLATGVIPGQSEDNPYGKCIVIDAETRVADGNKTSLTLSQGEDGVTVCDEIVVKGDLDFKLIRKLDKLVKGNGFAGIVIESVNREGEPYPFPLSLDALKLVTGTASHRAARTFFQILSHLEIELEERAYDNWEGHFYRLSRMLEGELEHTVADSSALMAKATKTPSIAYSCRIGTTIDASVGYKELHISAEMAEFWGLTENDFVLPGRVPVPGIGVLRLKLNPAVPFGTAVMNASTHHAIDEGDADGDQLVFLAFSAEGDLRMPKENTPSVKGFSD